MEQVHGKWNWNCMHCWMLCLAVAVAGVVANHSLRLRLLLLLTALSLQLHVSAAVLPIVDILCFTCFYSSSRAVPWKHTQCDNLFVLHIHHQDSVKVSPTHFALPHRLGVTNVTDGTSFYERQQFLNSWFKASSIFSSEQRKHITGLCNSQLQQFQPLLQFSPHPWQAHRHRWDTIRFRV